MGFEDIKLFTKHSFYNETFELFCKIMYSKICGLYKEFKYEIRTRWKSYHISMFGKDRKLYAEVVFNLDQDNIIMVAILIIPEGSEGKLLARSSGGDKVIKVRQNFPFKNNFTKKQIEQTSQIAFNWVKKQLKYYI